MDRALFHPAWGIEQNYSEWLTTLFPNAFNRPISADHQIEFWKWVWSVNPFEQVDPLVYIIARGGGKTTSVEAASVKFGAAGKKFVLYVRGTQDKANETVMNISSLLESSKVDNYYPELSNRKTGKYGQSKSWTQKMLMCQGGFSIVGLGMDVAVRGVKIEENRPDVIIFDDIDDKSDSYKAVKKKVETITKSILPAAGQSVSVLFIQNLIHANSIAAKLADTSPRGAKFLIDRNVIGPIPAIIDMVTKQVTGKDGRVRDIIQSGVPTWEGQNLEDCQRQINTYGLASFKTESQHEVHTKEGLVYNEFDHNRHVMPFEDMPDFIRGGAMPVYLGLDFGAVNTIMLLAYRDHGNGYYITDEVSFPQSTTSTKAQLAKRHYTGQVHGAWGGAGSEDEIRMNWRESGVPVQAPPHINDVATQVDNTNQLFKENRFKIASRCQELVFQLQKCRYDDKQRIEDKSIWHMLDGLRSMGDGIQGGAGVTIGRYTNR